MPMRLAAVLVSVVVACHGGAADHPTLATLRSACGDAQTWTGTACAPRGDAPAKIEAGKKAIAALKIDDATKQLDAAETSGPLDHDSNITLWEQRGIAASYLEDETAASTAFEMMLALDPGHFLSYNLSPKATLVFEKVRNTTRAHPIPAIDVTWAHGSRVTDPVPLDIDVIADPKQFLRKATLFVRTRGDSSWHAADLALDAPDKHILLPPVGGTKPTSIELYLRAYDDRGNEVLTWADASRPREIPLRYEPPLAWYRKWWVITLAASAVAIATGVTVYELTIAPPDKIGGSVGTARQ
jgi:hypothetical protein